MHALKTQLKGLLNGLLFDVIVLAVLYLCGMLLGDWKFLNEWTKGDVAIDMLKTIINVDSALIGFAGVIAVFGLREISRAIERAQDRPHLSTEDKDKLGSWQTNFLWSLSLTVLTFAASILFSLNSMSYATYCGLADNVLKCFIVDPQTSSRFLLPLYAMFLGMAGIVWIVWSLRNPLKFAIQGVRITIGQGFIAYEVGTSEPMMFFEAANIGERPIVLTSFPSLLLPDDMRLILDKAQRYFDFPYELPSGDMCELWQEASKLAEELRTQGYSGKMKLVCQFKDAVGNSYRSKPFLFDIDDWLGETADTKRERRYMKQCASCNNWIPLASEICGVCKARQPEKLGKR